MPDNEPEDQLDLNDPERNAQSYRSAMQAMSYMQSDAFGTHANVQLSGSGQTGQPSRKSRLEEVVDKAVQQVVRGVSREMQTKSPAREALGLAQLPEFKNYQGDGIAFLREPASEQPAQPDSFPASSEQAPAQNFAPMPEPDSTTVFTPVPAAAQDASRMESTEPRMAFPNTSLPPKASPGPVRPPQLDAIADALPERPMAQMFSGSGAVEPPRVEMPTNAEAPAMPRSAAALDRESKADWGDSSTEQITQREQYMHGADVVSDYAMTQGLLMEMMLQHLQGLTEKMQRMVVAMDRLTEDDDQ